MTSIKASVKVCVPCILQALQRLDHGGIGDADPANHQSGEADKRKKLCEAFEIAGELRRGIAARADFKGCIGKAFGDGLADCVQSGIADVRKLQPP